VFPGGLSDGPFTTFWELRPWALPPKDSREARIAGGGIRLRREAEDCCLLSLRLAVLRLRMSSCMPVTLAATSS